MSRFEVYLFLNLHPPPPPFPLDPSYHALHTKLREIRQQPAMATVSYPLSHNTQNSRAAREYFSVKSLERNSSSSIWTTPTPPLPHPAFTAPTHPVEEMCELFTGLLNQSSHCGRLRRGMEGDGKLAQLSLTTPSRAFSPPFAPSSPRGTMCAVITKFLTSATYKCFQRRTSC